MSDTRFVNRDLAWRWIADQSERNARAVLAVRAGVSSSTINQMFSGRCPGLKSRLKISKAMGVSEDELFPTSQVQKEFVFR
jgi:transcriptional regulator with XRE-family HTH domain